MYLQSYRHNENNKKIIYSKATESYTKVLLKKVGKSFLGKSSTVPTGIIFF